MVKTGTKDCWQYLQNTCCKGLIKCLEKKKDITAKRLTYQILDVLDKRLSCSSVILIITW